MALAALRHCLCLPVPASCGQKEEEAWDGGGCLGTAPTTVLESLAPAPRPLCMAPSHHQPHPPAPSLNWCLFCSLNNLSVGWEWAFTSSSIGIFSILCQRPAMGTQGRCCLLRELLSWEWASQGSQSLNYTTFSGGTLITMASGHSDAPSSQRRLL